MRYILIFCFMIYSVIAFADMLPVDSLEADKDMVRFYEGCLKIIEAENSVDSLKRNALYAEAMDLLNTRTTYNNPGIKLGKMKAVVKDSTGLSTNRAESFSYDYSYARSRFRNIEFSPKGVSRGMGQGCRVLDLVLKPGGNVICEETVKGDCKIVALSQPGGEIGFEVKVETGLPVETLSYGNGLMGFAHWNQDSGNVEYKITNLTDRELIVTLIAN